MWVLGVIAGVPLMLVLVVLLLRYVNFMKSHKGLVSVEELRDRFGSFDRVTNWDKIEMWYRKKKFEMSFSNCQKRLRRR